MKKMHKRAMALCLTAALCSGLFAGCGGEKNTAETQQATEAQAKRCADRIIGYLCRKD